ncbi:hypothetical protein HanRHA438_Chr06g0264961 [Helianthus annuus]|nr:hypothetical protein HanRHA438_Chr06g0264961 [Helianthus annuus]
MVIGVGCFWGFEADPGLSFGLVSGLILARSGSLGWCSVRVGQTVNTVHRRSILGNQRSNGQRSGQNWSILLSTRLVVSWFISEV